MPTVARHSARTSRISEDGRRRVTISPSFATSWIAVPAARPSLPPWPGISSTLWTIVPVGIWPQRHRVAGFDVGARART